MTTMTLLRRIERLEAQLAKRDERKQRSANDPRIQQATRDPYVWVTQHTKTYNEHSVEEGRPSPYEPFPGARCYPHLVDLFDLLQAERINWFEKSRDVMVSWGCVAFLTFNAMTVPRRGVLFQTQKEDKVVQLIEYAKCLYKCQPDWLREAFPLTKPIEKQPALQLRFANGSYVAGIPGGADQIRSYHPFGYLNDESSFQPDAGECYNEALAVVKGKIIFNSSAGPSWYADARRDIIRNADE
jgi:hypothetical protein